MDRPLPVVIPTEAVAAFCRRHGVTRLSLFGSVLRDDFSPSSDIDVLVEFAPGRTPGLGFFRMQDELTEILGRRVDLNTPNSLSPYFRDEVLREARTIHVAA
jgi:predicted nucleotidyltransferase